MADDESRRGADMPDADKSDPKNSQSNPDEKLETEAIVDSSVTESPEEPQKPTDGGENAQIPKPEASRDSEETKNQLAKAREELNRAREESARARDEVERAKKELAAAQEPSPVESPEPEKAVVHIEEQAQIFESKPEELPLTTTIEQQPEEPTEELCEKIESPPVEKVEESIPSENTVVESLEISELPAVESLPKAGETSPAAVDEDFVDAEEGEVSGEEESVDGVVVEGEGDDAPAKPLDDDEDRRNPQYIPKRGGFYEHDDRSRGEEGPQETTPSEVPVEEEKPKKGMRSEVVDRWGHDMFDENQQGPKSNNELVALYGYDIRQEEGAPRARRRRRYGRGPNKYDRTWEDEEAYSRPRGRGTPRGMSRAAEERPQAAPTKEDFPPLAEEVKQTEGNWREGRGRGGGKPSAISFRRGGGGRTFEERNKAKQEDPAPVIRSGSPRGGSARFATRGAPRGRGSPRKEEERPDQSNPARSKRYSSQRQRITTPPPIIQQQPAAYPQASTAYYAAYNDSPPPNFVPPVVAPFIAPPIAFNPGPYYPPVAPAPPVGVPISSPTQDYSGIMYYDPGRQPIRQHGVQPTRRAKAAIPIVAPEVDNYLE